MVVKIYDTDTLREVAQKIYNDFDVSASCSVFGFVERDRLLVPKGQIVLEYLALFDEIDHITYKKTKKERKYKYRPDSIGGPIANKIFTWEKRIVDGEPRYTIWRFQ